MAGAGISAAAAASSNHVTVPETGRTPHTAHSTTGVPSVNARPIARALSAPVARITTARAAFSTGNVNVTRRVGAVGASPGTTRRCVSTTAAVPGKIEAV